ncbi:MAG: DUF3343 domain-containing protein [Clostridiales bacterium]|nr:DUF3343 domain-containing protein [Clostridiales bacterium]
MILLAVFRSRAQSLDYGQRLNYYGVPATTMPTPKEAKIGCGLCVKFDARYYTRAQALVKTNGYSTFKGFYKMDFVNGKVTVFPYRI